MQKLLKKIEDGYKRKHVVDVRSGDSVRVHQRIKEGNKERVQVFEGLVIGTKRKGSATSTIAVRRMSGSVGVEKTFQVHSPLIEKIEVTKRSKVRRNRLNYMKVRSGKSARLASVDFDSEDVNIDMEEGKTEEPKNEDDTEPEAKDEAKEEIEEVKKPTEDAKDAETEDKGAEKEEKSEVQGSDDLKEPKATDSK